MAVATELAKSMTTIFDEPRAAVKSSSSVWTAAERAASGDAMRTSMRQLVTFRLRVGGRVSQASVPRASVNVEKPRVVSEAAMPSVYVVASERQ